MKKQLSLCAIVLVFVVILYIGYANKGDSSSDANETMQEELTMSPEEILARQRAYATDNDANDFEGYQKLLSQYKDLQVGQDDVKIDYDFKCKEYKQLLELYNIEEIAGTGSEFERVVRLMDHFSPQIIDDAEYMNEVEMNALKLLEYSLNQPSNGLNGNAQAKILSEMCLSLGIYARRVWLMPYSSMDNDSTVVVEIYDTTKQKWIMVDMANGCYFVNDEGMPLSVYELRDRYASGQFATCIKSSFEGTAKEANDDPEFSKINCTYIKNLFYFAIELYNGFGMQKQDECDFVPVGFDVQKRYIASAIQQIDQAEQEGKSEEDLDLMNKALTMIKGHRDYYNVLSIEVMTKSPIKEDK